MHSKIKRIFGLAIGSALLIQVSGAFAELPNSGKVSGEISVVGEIDQYTFMGNAGGIVYLRVADTETTPTSFSAFKPRVSLFNPDNQLVGFGIGELVAVNMEGLFDTGPYTVTVQDSSVSSDETGSYDLYYAQLPGANDDGCVAADQPVDGHIDLGDIDSYEFVANAGTTVVVTVTDLDNGPLFPKVALHDPSGNDIEIASNETSAVLTQLLTVDGVYNLIILDGGSTPVGTGNYRLNVTGTSVMCLTCNGKTVTVFLDNGDQTTPQDDVVLGTSGKDDIRGKAGNDTICGLGGDDFIHGNSGDDWIDGGEGIDNLRGGQGDDIIYTGTGATLTSSSRAFGGTGDDVINGGPDADDLRGGRGVDTIKGFGGDDAINGNADNDILNGGTGFDTVRGGDGDDDIRGGADSDLLDGGAGDDILNGGAGVLDVCDGGSGTGDMATASCETIIDVP